MLKSTHVGSWCCMGPSEDVCRPDCRFWARQIAEAGFIGLVLSQSPEYVAPHGSSQAVFGTNPIAVAVPTEGQPLVVDMATSAAAWYDLLKAQQAGAAVAADVGFDAQGKPTTDPGAILDGGAIRTFDRQGWVAQQPVRKVSAGHV